MVQEELYGEPFSEYAASTDAAEIILPIVSDTIYYITSATFYCDDDCILYISKGSDRAWECGLVNAVSGQLVTVDFPFGTMRSVEGETMTIFSGSPGASDCSVTVVGFIRSGD